MAETLLTVQEIDFDGITPALAAANSDGSRFENTGREFVWVKNGSGAPIDVTVHAQEGCDPGGIEHDYVVSVPATTGSVLIGPLDPKWYSDANGKAHITYASVTSLTVAVFTMGGQQ